MHRLPRLHFFIKAGMPALLFATLLSGCFDMQNAGDQYLQGQLHLADSLFYVNKSDDASVLLKYTRPKLKGKTNLLLNYYYLRCMHPGSGKEGDLYTDSAVALFKNKEIIEKYPDEYYHIILSKGDFYFRQGKFAIALDYFDKARQALLKTSFCDDGSLATRTATIYYGQKNFKMAARYLIEGYNRQKKCAAKVNLWEQFYLQAGALDNIAVSYEQAGMLDSADYYYREDLNLINNAIRYKKLTKRSTDAALAVLYDNMGGLCFKRGDLKGANYYLTSSLAIPDAADDGSRVAPLIKFAELQLTLGNLPQAYKAFTEGRKLLDKHFSVNSDAEIKWDRIYALYLTKTNKPDSAYYYLDRYIARKKNIDSSSTELNRLNVQREIETIQQQQSLANLSQQDKVKKIYVIGFGVIALLSLVIIYLVYRNLKKARKNHLIATLRNQQLQQTLGELKRVNQNYMRIMRVMAHDLRNPISGMIGLATVLQFEHEFSDDSKHMLQLIESTGHHSIDMINELLKSGLADENEQNVTQNIDLKSLLYDSVELLQFKAREKGQKILFTAPDDSVMVDANHEKMWRVFNNLIVNAIKFSHEGGEIKVEIKTLPNQVVVSFADNGIGIPAENRESIFEMFTPAKKAGTQGEQPFGLGLSISKRIVEMHHGKIWFESAVGVGTTFYLALPSKQ